jgi:hypothetical protein
MSTEEATMVSAETRSVAERAKHIYDERLRAVLEIAHCGQFVAIEPESGDHFLADTLDGAVRAARAKHPSRLSHVVRVGHPAALHLGGAWS